MRQLMPRKRALGVVGEMPVAHAVGGRFQREGERALFERRRPKRHRLVQGVAEPGVDVPVARLVVVGGKSRDRQHEVVGERALVGTVRPVDATDVPGHVVAERPEQLAERPVEVEAIAAPALERDATGRREGVDVPALAGMDPRRLVGDPLDVSRVEADQASAEGGSASSPSPLEICAAYYRVEFIGGRATPASMPPTIRRSRSATRSTRDWPGCGPSYLIVARATPTPTRSTSREDDARATWLPAPPWRTVVAVDGATIVGTARYSPNHAGPGDARRQRQLHGRPEYARARRRPGRSASTCSTQARTDGYRAMQFNAVVESNTAAVALWRSLGFEVLTTIPEAFRHPTLGLVGMHVMHRML